MFSSYIQCTSTTYYLLFCLLGLSSLKIYILFLLAFVLNILSNPQLHTIPLIDNRVLNMIRARTEGAANAVYVCVGQCGVAQCKYTTNTLSLLRLHIKDVNKSTLVKSNLVSL